MEIKREDIYSKEIDFRMATSYGRGVTMSCMRYTDWITPSTVRWTENRNMQEYLTYKRGQSEN